MRYRFIYEFICSLILLIAGVDQLLHGPYSRGGHVSARVDSINDLVAPSYDWLFCMIFGFIILFSSINGFRKHCKNNYMDSHDKKL